MTYSSSPSQRPTTGRTKSTKPTAIRMAHQSTSGVPAPAHEAPEVVDDAVPGLDASPRADVAGLPTRGLVAGALRLRGRARHRVGLADAALSGDVVPAFGGVAPLGDAIPAARAQQ